MPSSHVQGNGKGKASHVPSERKSSSRKSSGSDNGKDRAISTSKETRRGETSKTTTVSSKSRSTFEEGDIIIDKDNANQIQIMANGKLQKRVKPDDLRLDENADFYREVHTLWVYEGRLLASTGFRGYVNWNDKTLSSKFENHALEDQEIRALEKLVHHMKKGSKVRARNVVCLALGSLLDRSRTQRNRSLQQFTVLLKVVELLGISRSSVKIIQDPDFTPRDGRFFAKHHFQTMEDPDGIAAIDSETLLYYLGGYDEVTLRIMDRPKPAVFISNDVAWSSHGMKDSDITAKQRKVATMGDGYAREAMPAVGKGNGMERIYMYWRKA